EIVRRAVAKRTKHNRIRPQGAVSTVGDVDAVDDVLILETARSSDRWIGDADIAGAYTRSEVKCVAEAPPDRQARECAAIEPGANRRARRVDRRRGDLNRFLNGADLQRQGEFNRLSETDLHVGAIDVSESLEFRMHAVGTWSEKWNGEPSVAAAHRCLGPLRA